MEPEITSHFKSRKPSVIRVAQIEFSKRKDSTKAINVAIGNVSLPMHPAMQARLQTLPSEGFPDNVVKYTSTKGIEETNKAFLNIIASSGFSTQGLFSQITDGASHAIELTILGTCSKSRPLLLIDPAYTNYKDFAFRLGIPAVSISRYLQENGTFTLPSTEDLESIIQKQNPGAIVVIPYDNPTGQFFTHSQMLSFAKLCVKHNLWMISDEAYREIYYTKSRPSSIWGLTNQEVPGIEGRRISLETSSKVWNACGLRIGALVTDNKEFHEKAIAENTANLCADVIGQYIFGALAHESHPALHQWYAKQRTYYMPMMQTLAHDFKLLLPGIIVSNPDAAIYSVVDVRKIAKPGFDALDFVLYCARKGSVALDSQKYTVLVTPMQGFYSNPEKGKAQMRIAFVHPPEEMEKVPKLFAELFKQYESQR